MGGRSALRKIKFAKKWLEKAERAYLQGKREEGFLSLSLAEAEIRTLQEKEWGRSTGFSKRGFRWFVEIVFVAILIVFSFSSYLSLEGEAGPSVFIPQVSAKFSSSYGTGIAFRGRCLASIPRVSLCLMGNISVGGERYLAFSLPELILSVKGGVFRSESRGVVAHILYLEPRVSVKSERRELISPEEMLRLVELGKREFKAYIAGGR